MPTSALFRPRLLDCLRGYSRSDFRADISAGVTLGIIALSLSMALGIASGATPAVGIVTGIVAGFLVSALGGSKVAIGGPTAAFIPVVAAVAQEHGADSLVICTALAGLMLMGLGFARMGAMIKYIPMPVVAGFTAGIAVYILSTQLRDFLGLQLKPGETVPADFIHKLTFIARHLGDLHWPAALLAVLAAALVKLWPANWARWVPPSLAAVVLGTVAVTLFPLGIGPSAAASGRTPSRSPCRARTCRCSTSTRFVSSSGPPSPSRCWAPSSRCSAAWWRTA